MSKFARLWPCLALLALLSPGCSNNEDSGGGGTAPTSPPAIERFFVTALGGEVRFGEYTQLRWDVDRATAATITPSVGPVSVGSGSVNIRPHETTTYTLTVSNSAGSDSASTTVTVEYPGGIYVDSVKGDDSRDGTTPQTAVWTLDEGLAKAASVGVIYLSAGRYDTNITIDGQHLEIYAGLNPETFFEEPDFPGLYNSFIEPTSGTPVTIRNTFEAVVLENLVLRAPSNAEYVVDIQDAGNLSRRVTLNRCTLDGRVITGTAGAALRIRGTSAATVSRCRIRGPISRPVTRGVLIEDAAGAVITNCFIHGGLASERSSGIEVSGTGLNRFGLNTIGAEIQSFGLEAAAIRINGAGPAIGGNILFTPGGGRRFGILEEGPDSNPARFEGNLFASVGFPAYSNFEGEDAATEAALNDWTKTTSDPNRIVFGNKLTSIVARDLFRDIDLLDYHLVSPINDGMFTPNPAVSAGDNYLYSEDYGAVNEDIDGERRPRPSGNPANTDLGADEF